MKKGLKKGLNVCTDNVVYVKHRLSFWESGCWHGRSYLADWPLMNVLGTGAPASFPGRQHLARLEELQLVLSFQRERLLESSTAFLWSLCHVSFPFPDVTLCPFSRINLSLSPTVCWVPRVLLSPQIWEWSWGADISNKGLLGPNSVFMWAHFTIGKISLWIRCLRIRTGHSSSWKGFREAHGPPDKLREAHNA